MCLDSFMWLNYCHSYSFRCWSRVGLNEGDGGSSPTPTIASSPPTTNNPNSTSGHFWKPTVGKTWQVVLQNALDNSTVNASVYDIDLFTKPAATFSTLHSMNRKVICYFSAGSYEPNRPDSPNFNAADKGKELQGWPGEYWLNTSSPNVRNIMYSRLQLAATKGCDGVDPDNIDGYDNDNGLSLTKSDAIDYLTFLAIGAHSLGMSLGLKNGGDIVNQTLPMMQWAVNEQCVQYNDCELFNPFIEIGKPFFHIEYPADEKGFSTSQLCGIGTNSTDGFSTVLKSMDLDDEVAYC